jgi:hypothetical protein
MITLIIITVVIWTLVRIVQFVARIWRSADAPGSPSIGLAAAA